MDNMINKQRIIDMDIKAAIIGMADGDHISGEWHHGPSEGQWAVNYSGLGEPHYILTMLTTREGASRSVETERDEHFDHPMAVFGYLQAFGASL